MRLNLIVAKNVAKTFGIKLDDNLRPKRDKQGQIETTSPKVPRHVQEKFIRFLDEIEGCKEYEDILRVLKGFEFKKLEPSKYTKKILEKAVNLIFRIHRIGIKKDKVRLVRIKLSRDYRVTLGLVVGENGEVVVFILVLSGGSREDYYTH